MARDKYLGVPEATHESEHQWQVAPGATKVNICGSNRQELEISLILRRPFTRFTDTSALRSGRTDAFDNVGGQQVKIPRERY
jgi:hypothetical protein